MPDPTPNSRKRTPPPANPPAPSSEEAIPADVELIPPTTRVIPEPPAESEVLPDARDNSSVQTTPTGKLGLTQARFDTSYYERIGLPVCPSCGDKIRPGVCSINDVNCPQLS